MFSLYDLEIDDENVHEVQTQMTKLVNVFFEVHEVKALEKPSEWSYDQYAVMLVYGYFGAFSFDEFGYEDFDDFFDRYYQGELNEQEKMLENDLKNLFIDLERLYNSLSID